MLKRLMQILCVLLVYATGSAYAITCQSNEFEYDGNCIENKFQITTTNDTNKFVFNMSAKGTFYIDWGDGNVQMINRTGTTITEYTHNYASANEYIIKFGGRATGYTTVGGNAANMAAILFGNTSDFTHNNTYDNIKQISGSLGAIFPTIGTGSTSAYQPRFYTLFYKCSNLIGPIPADLFSGITGKGQGYMFRAIFAGCTSLSGTDIDDPNNPGMKYAIPPTLFSGLSGAPATYMFYAAFNGCSGLTGTIPGDLFSGLSGKPAASMFSSTFYKCSNLTGTDIDDPNNPGMKYAIPPTLFAGISGAPATSMFNGTFSTCSKINGTIPGNLFSGIQGRPANSMFTNTFYSCFYLKGQIPGDLFSGIIGKPATSMFYRTFYNDSRLSGSVPPELFAGIDKSTEATDEMYQIFHGTNSMATSCPAGTTQYITGFESYWENRKSCTQCSAEYPLYDSTNDTCYAQVTFIDSDNNTLLKKEDVYYDGNNGSGYNLPSYSPTKPDTVLDNWENGSGTVIGANDVLTGNQVLYSDWGFHCDSGKYFHLGNNSQVCVAETKRTEHALVIQVDPEHTYYIHATPNSEHDYTINSSSIHKLKADYNGTIYNLHDASVYFNE